MGRNVPPPINLLVIFASATVSMAIWMVWYSPLLFGKSWSAFSGVSERKTGATKKSSAVSTAYAVSFVGSLVMAYMLAYILYYTGSTAFAEGAKKGAMMWAGFVATTMAAGTLFENRPKQLFVINAAYHLVSMMAMGAILAVWA